MDRVEKLIMSSDKEDSELLSKYIDMDSWAQKNIIEELISEAEWLRYIDSNDVCSDTGIKQRVYAMWQLNRLRSVQIVQYERVAMVERV